DFLISGPSSAELLATLCATGRTFLPGPQMASPIILTWDPGPPWTFDLVIKKEAKSWQISGRLKREGGESMTLLEPRFLTDSGVLCVRDTLVPFDAGGSYSWIDMLRKEGSIQVPLAKADELVRELMGIRNCPPIDWPEELKFEEIRIPPQPRATFLEPKGVWSALTAPLKIELAFAYGEEVVLDDDSRKGFYLEQPRRLVTRDFEAENQAIATLDATGAKINKYGERPRWEIPRKRVPSAVRDLVRAGWQVQLDGKAFRNARSVNAEIRSGIDWFEVHGAIDYGDGTAVPFPRLLQALERGEHHIQLGDGTLGVLPDEFLAQYGSLLRLGKKDGDHIRFSRAQTSLLDALLFERGQVSADEVFMRARAGLRQFEGVNAAPQPKQFEGELRHYQLEGLGWMEFLRSLGLGGCLADDMGVGKTPQVLALLENRRILRQSMAADAPERPRASLVVVPRSLIYNWKQEAARFTPQLRVLDHSLPGRFSDLDMFDENDVILTTYGLLRRDVVDFRDYEFDYVVLDEAQAIKNANSASAKAARLLKARNRLVMSGTPIENHLGELWSLFEFLNPGMLGAASVFQKGTASLKNPDAETRELLSKALRPLILRRTKDQVIKELPPKLEQTIYCEMDPDQRKLYEEMRDHYRGSLLGRISKQGMAKSKMHILEALLRLRQAACHPGLIDKTRTGEVSAKLESLLPQLEEVMNGGHKAIVFSQFTSLLAILRGHLDKEKVVYEYLDGKTKDRQAAVERFQGDDDCKLFLVSLKAGGLGLNLTAAEYVFLLDPWWNPAVESQAIDRAHRIGQKKAVFAYRLICKGTVEEKVLELQKSKRDLADAIIGEDNRLIGSLQREDLELLLS
ncbi:MAG TPA: DEAD/DEAH box helicase, partial [Bryobacteraceae bacterium]